MKFLLYKFFNEKEVREVKKLRKLDVKIMILPSLRPTGFVIRKKIHLLSDFVADYILNSGINCVFVIASLRSNPE
jgi:DNA recombination-dependent growth factor C